MHLAPQMMRIVEWVAKLDELDFETLENQVYSPVSFPLSLRKDEALESLSPEEALAGAPEKSQGFITVPKVIEKK